MALFAKGCDGGGSTAERRRLHEVGCTVLLSPEGAIGNVVSSVEHMAGAKMPHQTMTIGALIER